MTGNNISPDGVTFSDLGRGDIKRKRFNGPIRPGQSFQGNFVECYFDNLELSSIDFARCDWKDCRAQHVVFIDCELTHASMITNSFENCTFLRCRFTDTGISDGQFTSCHFDHCDLQHVIVKTSRFEDCSFEKCATSNRIIESSLLMNTRWQDMEINVGLITGNFGLKAADLTDCDLVRFDEYKQILASPLDEILALPSWSVLERFRLIYFQAGTVEADSEMLEEAIDPRHWTGDAPIQASLGTLLTLFSQFLLAEYSYNAMTFYPILRFHTHNFALLEWLTRRHDQSALYQTSAGVHLTLTREVDEFLAVVENLAARLDGKSNVHLAAEGPVDAAYFSSLLADLRFGGVSVYSVTPRNSPVDLALIVSGHPWLISLVALVLSAKTKFELRAIEAGEFEPEKSSASRQLPSNPLVAVKTGFLLDGQSDFVISVKSVMPHSLLLDMHLAISMKLLMRVRDTFLFFISGSGPAHNPPPAQESPRT